MADEIDTFRKLAKRIYDTMTQDVTDVLTNEHVQAANFFKEQIAYFEHRQKKAVAAIFSICPDFDYDSYYSDKEGYLQKMLPLPEEVRPMTTTTAYKSVLSRFLT